MSETTFTPGPWNWDGNELVADGGFLVLGAGIAKNGASYISVKDEDKPIIAAAPEMYEALTECLAHFDKWFDAANDDQCHVVGRVKAALAKARGEAP